MENGITKLAVEWWKTPTNEARTAKEAANTDKQHEMPNPKETAGVYTSLYHYNPKPLLKDGCPVIIRGIQPSDKLQDFWHMVMVSKHPFLLDKCHHAQRIYTRKDLRFDFVLHKDRRTHRDSFAKQQREIAKQFIFIR